MMLVFSACFGVKLINRCNKRFFKVFTRLGGHCVGRVEMLQSPCELVDLVRDLQRQVAKMLPHPTRTSNYLAFYVGGTKLPSFKYWDEVDQELELEAFEALEKLCDARNGAHLECMYDEDDSRALQLLQCHYGPMVLQRTHDINGLCLLPQLRALKYTHDPKIVSLKAPLLYLTGNDTFDLGVLASFSNLTDLMVTGGVVPSWDFAKLLPIKRCALQFVRNFPVLTSECFPNLEELDVFCTADQARTGFEFRLPKLQNLRFLGNYVPLAELRARMMAGIAR